MSDTGFVFVSVFVFLMLQEYSSYLNAFSQLHTITWQIHTGSYLGKSLPKEGYIKLISFHLLKVPVVQPSNNHNFWQNYYFFFAVNDTSSESSNT